MLVECSGGYTGKDKEEVVTRQDVRHFSPRDIDDFERKTYYDLFWRGDDKTCGGYYEAVIVHMTGKLLFIEVLQTFLHCNILPICFQLQKLRKKCTSGGERTGKPLGVSRQPVRKRRAMQLARQQGHQKKKKKVRRSYLCDVCVSCTLVIH